MVRDLLYFGHDSQSNSRLEQSFIEEALDKFPNAKMNDAYDEVKGLRQGIEIEVEDPDEYYAWVLVRGWADESLNLSLIAMDDDQRRIQRILALAKERYPAAFKDL